MRIAVNGVARDAAAPARGGERRPRQRARDEATAAAAGELAIAGAVPLHHNAYKVPLLRNLVRRAVRGTEILAWTS